MLKVTSQDSSAEVVTVKAAFGAVNRARLINEYFDGHDVTDLAAGSAWSHAYRLLLWIDQTTGLAHCYESDKCQPGKNWYARSLAFHDWVSTSLDCPPGSLALEIDWLFLRATKDLAAEVVRSAERVIAAAAKQRHPYKGRGFPKPGEDPDLVLILKEVLEGHLTGDPSPAQWQMLVQRIRQHLALENKRKNLVGEGFEDVLGQIVERSCANNSTEVFTRRALHDLPGFNRARQGEKPNKVDLAVVRPGMRTIVTAKWSVRADREKQFTTEFGEYVNAESDSKPFEYVFITNEFDPARLRRACDKLAGNSPMFTHVVHISTDAIKATYGDAPEESMQQVLTHIAQDRLISLDQWLAKLRS